MKLILLAFLLAVSCGTDSNDSNKLGKRQGKSTEENENKNTDNESGLDATANNPEKKDPKEKDPEDNQDEDEQITPPAEDIPDEPSLATGELYQLYSTGNQDHDYLFDPTSNEDGVFRVFVDLDVEETIPLFRCYSEAGSNHFVSIHENCESGNGQVYENLGIYGYVYEAHDKGIPLIRCYKVDIFDHAIADKDGNCPAGYNDSATIGSYPAK